MYFMKFVTKNVNLKQSDGVIFSFHREWESYLAFAIALSVIALPWGAET